MEGILIHNPAPFPQRVVPGDGAALWSVLDTRALERAAASSLPAHTLMQRAGQAVAQLAAALAPHAQRIWIACGPGNNGGDGLEAALHLHQRGTSVVVNWLGDPQHAPADARRSWERARAAGVVVADAPPSLGPHDLAIDALLGIGNDRAPEGALAEQVRALNACGVPVLSVDVPSGLLADTGHAPGALVRAQHTLALLTLKPGLFTGLGRDAAGQCWWHALGVAPPAAAATAWLAAAPVAPARLHASHKGSYGDVAIVGGESLGTQGMGMTGAALLAATAALHAGAGRVLVALLGASALEVHESQPELMLRHVDRLDLPALTVVCGCGGGRSVASVLPSVLKQAARLVLDADALNTVARDPQCQRLLRARADQGQPTVLTPHPLEAARLLGCSAAEVQRDRLGAAAALAQRWQCTVVLKGSGTVTADPAHAPCINPTGNARLATAGTGDVLAGAIGAGLAQGLSGFDAAGAAVYRHGAMAQAWPGHGPSLTASALARMF